MTFLSFATCERAHVFREIAYCVGFDMGLSYFRPAAGDCIWFHFVGIADSDSTVTIYISGESAFYDGAFGSGVIDNWGELILYLKDRYRRMTDEERLEYSDD